MKLTIFLLTAVCLHASAAGYGQKETVTISGKDLPLEKVFSVIKKQTDYVCFYGYDVLKDARPVSLSFKDAEVAEVLKAALWGQGLDFSITGRTISIVRKEPLSAVDIKINDAGIEARGIVLAESGQPLSGASITIRETKKSTLTNARGEFFFSKVPVNSTLIFSFIGYTPKQLLIKDTSSIRINLSVAVNELDQTIVQAYGTTSRRISTSDIGKVTAEEISKQPVMNPLLALQGKVPGLVVTQLSGFASAPVKVEIRGRNNIDKNFPWEPLYIIDGVPLSVVDLSNSNYTTGSHGFIQNGFGGPAGGQSPLFSINPSDIESIEVLKDADATAIYGSRAANGVILITTKRGKMGKTKFDLNIQQGMNKVTRYYDMLNTPQYLAMRREAFKNSNITPTPGNAPDLLVWDTTKYTDWQRYLWGGTGKNTDVQMGLSGGNSQTTFRLGAGYTRATNILTVSGADQRGSVSFNLSHHSLNQRLGISFVSNYSFTQSDMISLPGAATLSPDAPPIYNAKGALNYDGWAPLQLLYPFASLLQPYTAKTNFLNSNLTVSYQVLNGLSIRTSFGYNNAQNDQLSLTPITAQDPSSNPLGSAFFGNNTNKNWNIEPQIEYSGFLGRGKLNILIGGSAQQGTTQGTLIQGKGYTNDALLKTISNAPEKDASDNYGQYKYSAVFGRINYNWENKYIVNVSARRDGSSNFGSGNQFGNFASLGAAWVFTEENWLDKHHQILSFGKLRGSYGTTGGDGPAYGYLSRWMSSYPNYNNIVPLAPTQLTNPNYHWQVNKKLEMALDLGFLKDKINITVAYYRNRCGNQIVAFPTPEYTGFTSVPANSPALVQNMGWEFNSTIRIIDTKDFHWSLSFNTAINRNKLISYPNFELSPYTNTLVIGQSLNIVKLLHYTGVDPQTGQYTFLDKNKDGSIGYTTGPTDDRIIYNLNPKFNGGLGSSFSYKGMNLSLFFNIAKQLGVNALTSIVPGTMQNVPTSVLSRWQKPGDISSVARFVTLGQQTDTYFISMSDGVYTDASFIRLSNLSFSYTLPESIIKKAGLQGCSLFVHAQNLFVITKYKGIDPETQNFGGMPPAKIYTGGISFNF